MKVLINVFHLWKYKIINVFIHVKKYQKINYIVIIKKKKLEMKFLMIRLKILKKNKKVFLDMDIIFKYMKVINL